jgi:hypothetical protein
MDSDPGTDVGSPDISHFGAPLVRYTDTPETRWTAWAIWSAVTLVMALLAVLGAGFDTGLLLGWAAGIIVAAILMVLGR